VYRYGPPSREALEAEIRRLSSLLDKESPQPILNIELANAYLTLGKWEQAIEVLHQITRTGNATIDPATLAQAYFMLGNIYSKNGYLVEAINSYEQALRIQPENEMVSSVLANLDRPIQP
jgi:tetratricopeptide (TPR) repeat protein